MKLRLASRSRDELQGLFSLLVLGNQQLLSTEVMIAMIASRPYVAGDEKNRALLSGGIFSLLSTYDRYKTADWDEMFQESCAWPDSVAKFESQASLSRAFLFTAQQYARVIIEEFSMPNHTKTIKPISIGGIAGGEKFVVGGIMFKFPSNVNNMYQGLANAMKAAGHELRGLNAYANTKIPGLCVPLSATIDYRGFRITAIAYLPWIKTEKTLVYGSADAGKTVLASDAGCNEKMKAAAAHLRVKEHKVGPKDKLTTLAAAGDIEVHKHPNGSFYVLDCARAFPPEYSSDHRCQYSVLWNMLRPEYLRLLEEPLSPDAWTRFSEHDPDGPQMNSAVQSATDMLYTLQIPRFTGDLESLYSEKGESLFLGTPDFLTVSMHHNGINMRHC
eukprot:TRINITY_DN6459_c0_g1_i2.p1 TRINITY_DN6459_c0_g1~~TRINITY_DN6459_c0_g1_i2.p1  ORF type:complete len:388 (-),score=29.84 TRINITY_DN6459_c0_g1_i2:685-1848(-)